MPVRCSRIGAEARPRPRRIASPKEVAAIVDDQSSGGRNLDGASQGLWRGNEEEPTLSSGRPFSGRESPTLASSALELLSSIGLIPPYRSRHAEESLADSRLITPPNGGSSPYFTTPSFK